VVAWTLRGRGASGMRSASLAVAAAVLLLATGTVGATAPSAPPRNSGRTVAGSTPQPVANLSAAINRLVELVGAAGAGLLALVWARVALSWFSHDITKKVQAKDRARDALIGTLLFVAAVTGLVWGLAHWVVTGT
jgi:hypothetical protein